MSACEKGHRRDQALLLLLQMQRFWLESTVISSNAAISACAKGQQWQQALAMMSETRR